LNSDGKSYRKEDKVLTINVKPGWKAGTKITFHREGDQNSSTIPADIVFIIRDKPHPHFKREDADLKFTAKITSREVLIVYWVFLIRVSLIFQSFVKSFYFNFNLEKIFQFF
jgi:DnaJ-class molecular chaperone